MTSVATTKKSPPGVNPSTTAGLTLGRLPKGNAWIMRVAQRFANALMDAVIESGGRLDVYTLALIQTAVKWERHSMMAQKWLREHIDKMNPDTRLAYSREIARASAERDRTLRQLGLDRHDEGDVLSLLATARHDAQLEAYDEAATADDTEATELDTTRHTAAGETTGAGAV